MARAFEVKNETGRYIWVFCPGCDTHHMMPVDGTGHPNWGFNENVELPTFTPSIRTFDNEGTICHSFITDGRILFLTDCRHKLAGHTVDLPEVDPI